MREEEPIETIFKTKCFELLCTDICILLRNQYIPTNGPFQIIFLRTWYWDETSREQPEAPIEAV